MDRISKKQRSINMSHIHGTETTLEVKVRKYLFSYGFRYRKNDKKLPGKPDIVLKKYNAVIFINGCFWHHHENCKYAYIPKTNTVFWKNKFEKNMINDKKNSEKLTNMGFQVLTVWECKLKENFYEEMNMVIEDILSCDKSLV